MTRFVAGGLLAVLAGGTLTPPAAAQSALRDVFTRSELEAAGVHRMGEVLQRVTRWNGTAEGVAWFLAPDALPVYALPRGLPEWTVMVDGQRVETGALGAVFAELAPLLVQQIDSVVVVRHPGIAGGTFVPRGVLHVHSRSLPRGVFARADVRTGSETGDPGPYLATARITPNVDRNGYDASAMLGYGGRGWEVEAGLRRMKQNVTDPRLVELYDTKKIQSYTTVRGPALRASAEAFGGRHHLLLGRTDQSGFVHLPALGRMERSAIRYTHAGASGTVALSPATRSTYRVTRSSLSLGRVEDSLPARAPARRTSTHAALGVQHDRGSARLEAGAELADRAFTGGGVASESRRTHLTLFAQAARTASAAWSDRYAVALVAGDGGLAGKGSATGTWTPDSARSLAGVVALSRQLPGEDGDWMDAPFFRFAAEPPPASSILLWSELVWRQPLGRALWAEAGGVYGHVAQTGERGRRSLPGVLRPDGAGIVRGGRAGVRLGLGTEGSRRLSGRVVYQSVGPVAASETLERALHTLPRHSLAGTLVYTPVPSLELALLLDHRAATSWRAVGTALEAREGELDPVSRFDLALQKWFWQRRLRTRLAVQNVLGTPERYHPRGADFDLRFSLTGAISLQPQP